MHACMRRPTRSHARAHTYTHAHTHTRSHRARCKDSVFDGGFCVEERVAGSTLVILLRLRQAARGHRWQLGLVATRSSQSARPPTRMKTTKTMTVWLSSRTTLKAHPTAVSRLSFSSAHSCAQPVRNALKVFPKAQSTSTSRPRAVLQASSHMFRFSTCHI